MSQELLLQRIQNALSTIFLQQNSHSSHDEADQFLIQFQNSQDAWMICDQLLRLPVNSNSAEAVQLAAAQRFYAAQTLYMKLKRKDFYDLPVDSLPALRDSLMQSLFEFCGSQQNKALVTRLSLCVAVLAARMCWNTVISDLTSYQSQNVAHTIPVLHILSNLPEEMKLCSKDEYIGSIREEVYRVLYPFLDQLVDKFATSTETLQIVFVCIDSYFHFLEIPYEYLIQSNNHLVRSLFAQVANGKSLGDHSNNGSKDEELFEAAVDALVTLFRVVQVPQSWESPVGRVTFQFISLCVDLADSVHRATASSAASVSSHGSVTANNSNICYNDLDEDFVRGFVRVLSECGETFYPLFLELPNDQSICALVQRFVQILSDCVRLKVFVLHFWNRFLYALEHLRDARKQHALLDFYHSTMVTFLDHLITLLNPNISADTDDDTLDEDEDMYLYLQDALGDLSRILGPDVISQQLQSQLNSGRSSLPGTIQSGLYTYSAICDSLRSEDTTARNLLHLIISNTLKQHQKEETKSVEDNDLNLHANPQLRKAAFYFFGRCAFLWTEDEAQTVIQCILMQLDGTGVDSLRRICQLHSSLPSTPLLETYMKSCSQLDVKEEVDFIECICCMQSLSSTDLQQLIAPIHQRLSVSQSSRSVLTDLERLTAVVRSYSGRRPDIIVQVCETFLPLLEKQSKQHIKDGNIAEKLCRFYKHSLRGCRDQFMKYLDHLINLLVENFSQSGNSPYLYAASIVTSEYGNEVVVAGKLTELVNTLCEVFFSNFTSFEQFRERPDVVEEFFYFMGRVVHHMPGSLAPFLPASSKSIVHLEKAIQYSATALRVEHREVNKAALVFTENTLRLVLNRSHTSIEQKLVDQVLPELALSSVGALPAYNLDTLSGVLALFNQMCPEDTLDNIQRAFSFNNCTDSIEAKELVEGLQQKADRRKLNYLIRGLVRNDH